MSSINKIYYLYSYMFKNLVKNKTKQYFISNTWYAKLTSDVLKYVYNLIL